jgi:signal transduction histidine kinase
MGLGLFLTRSVVERLGGALELGGGADGGTRVTLRLPWELRPGR